ncbi:MAG: hypothetical protein ACKVU4_12730 [Phycisphaerales bacterium]
MKMTKLVAACSALALGATAGSALAGPGRASSANGPRVPQAGPTVQRAHALRAAKFTKIDGRIVLTSPWIDRAGAGGVSDTTVVPAFDCYEGDPNSFPGLNVPSGFLTCGNNGPANPGAGPGNRWYFGPANVQPRTFNDMTLASGFNGADSTRVSFAWTQPLTTGSVFIAISTYETFGTACQFPATPGFIDGVILEYGLAVPVPPATITGFYADEDLTTGTTPLSLGLPADGSGAYDIEFYSDELATTLVTVAGIQPFYWGTGEDEPVPDGRAGTQEPPEFADDTAPFGGAYGATECYQMNQPTLCPTVFGVMMEFWAKQTVTVCYPDCNLSGSLTVADFGCFQGKYVLGDPYADCNASGTLTVADFGCYQGKYVLGCP